MTQASQDKIKNKNTDQSVSGARHQHKHMNYIALKQGSIAAPLLKKYAYRITNTIKASIKGTINNDPVAKQYIPDSRELVTLPEEDTDPIGDNVHSPVKGIVHRYPDRVLFKPANVCAVYCRYCFRRESVGPGSEILTADERKAALDYIRSHKEIWEVILTGGDPLILSPKQLSEILKELNTIEHVRVIRIHTRVPIADPKRINNKLIKAIEENTDWSVLSARKPVYLVVHVNHAQEITQDVRIALHALRQSGCILLSQSVLLKGVNNAPQTLENLFRELVTLGVKPYYLHHPDLAPGTSHFRLSIEAGQKIVKSLQGRVSGICLPTYMLDIPGGHGKIPLTPCFIKQLENDTYSVENYKGESFTYPPTKTNRSVS